MKKYEKISILFLFTIIIASSAVTEISADVYDARIETIYTKPYHEKYQHSFKIHAGNESVGPYAIHIESDIDSKIIKEQERIESNSWVQWFIYIHAEDPQTVKVNLLPI